MLRTEKLNIMDLDGKIALRRIAISLIASLFGLLAIAQPYKSTLAADPERAGGVRPRDISPFISAITEDTAHAITPVQAL